MPTFKQDLGGFFFHLSMVALIGFCATYTWHLINPQIVIRVTTEQAR